MKRKWPTAAEFIRANAGRPGCWEYPGRIDRDGYAFYKEGGICGRAHRAVYAEAYAAPPGGVYVCHACDNPRCCNPAHLFLGTARDNALDAKAKGRNSRGERNGWSKLTEEQVRAIRGDSRRQIDIAAEYGIRQTTVSEIKRGNRWSHVA